MEIEFVVTSRNTDEEITLRITGTIDWGSKAITSGPPDAWEPGVDPEVEITEIDQVLLTKTVTWSGELTDEEEKRALKELLQEAKDEANEQLGNVAADRAEERNRYDDYLD